MRQIWLVILLLLTLAAPATALKVQLSWNAVTGDSVTGYRVYYSTVSPEGPFDATGAVEGDSPIDVGANTSSTLSGLTDGTPYYFAVTAYNAENIESPLSGVVCNYWMPTLTYPADGATAVPTQPTVTWSTPPEGKNYTFTVYYGTNPAGLQAVPAGGAKTSGMLPENGMAALLATLLLCSLLTTAPRRRLLPSFVLALALLTSCSNNSGTTGSGTTGIETTVQTSMTLGQDTPLAAGQTYYWKVEVDDGSVVVNSEMHSFTTGS